MATNQDKTKSAPLLNRIWNQLTSMKFAIIVLIVLAVVSVLSLFIGEFYPVRATGPGWQEFWRQQLGLSKPLFDLFTFLELHDPFRSWWYQILLLLLSLSLSACIIERIPIALRASRPGAPRAADEITKLSASKKFNTKKTPEDLLKGLPHLFSFRQERQEDEWRISGIHGGLAYFGPILAHSGLLCLALGGLLASWLGFSTRVGGLPGDVLNDPGINFAVRVDSFKIEYYPLGLGQYVLMDGSHIGRIVGREGDGRFLVETTSSHRDPVKTSVEASRLRNQFDIEMDQGNIRDYVSVLTVLEDGREMLHSRVEVNHPLRYKGYRFYQTSFDAEHPRVDAGIDSAQVVATRLADNVVLDTLYLRPGKPVRLPDRSELVLARFLPDFRLDGSMASSASGELRNPALQLEVSRDGKKLYHQWAFLLNPFRHASADAAYGFEALNLFGFHSSITYRTILEVKRNPGSWLIWLGFGLATVGLILSFYLVPQRLWLAIRQKEKGGSEVIIGGVCTKNPDLFSRRFDAWVRRLKTD